MFLHFCCIFKNFECFQSHKCIIGFKATFFNWPKKLFIFGNETWTISDNCKKRKLSLLKIVFEIKLGTWCCFWIKKKPKYIDKYRYLYVALLEYEIDPSFYVDSVFYGWNLKSREIMAGT